MSWIRLISTPAASSRLRCFVNYFVALVLVLSIRSFSGYSEIVGALTVTVAAEIMGRVEDEAGVPGLAHIVVALPILPVLYRRPDGLVGPSKVDDLLRRRLLVAALRPAVAAV